MPAENKMRAENRNATYIYHVECYCRISRLSESTCKRIYRVRAASREQAQTIALRQHSAVILAVIRVSLIDPQSLVACTPPLINNVSTTAGPSSSSKPRRARATL